MAYFRCGGGGIPSSLKTDMNAVLNKKFGTQSENYPPTEWADDVNLMGLLPIRTASGTIAHFSDGADDVPMKSVVANIVPIQDLHGYSKPWAGGAGKNKVESKLEHCGIGTAGVLVVSDSQPYDMQISKVKNGVTYTITTDENTLVGGFFTVYPTNGATTYDGQRVVSNSKTFTSPIDGYFAFRTSYGYATAQIEEGSTATSYEPYANVCPISGTDELTLTQTGKNIFSIIPKLEELNITYSVDNDGWITLPSISQASSALYASPSKIPLLNNGSALFLIDAERTTATNVRLRLYKDGTAVTETPSGNNPVNRREDFSFNEVGLNWSQSGSATFKIVIANAPTIETTYEAYKSETYTFDLGQEILGGTADLVGGVGSKTMAEIDLGDLTWIYRSAQNCFSANINEMPLNTVLYCDVYGYSNVQYVEQLPNGNMWNKTNAFGSHNIAIKDTRFDNATDFKNAVTGYKLAYEVTTPTEYTFTGQPINSYLGVNNLWTDSGEVLDVEYRSNF